jgi:hypothetical protein
MDRLLGLLLFLPVPLVLILFTRMPLGMGVSLALGVAIMVTHRLYARPFARSRAERRCLWCGGPATAGPRLQIQEPEGSTTWRACGEQHAAGLARVLHWTARHSTILRLGILGTLGVFLIGTPVAAAGRLWSVSTAHTVGLFRLGIAATVLPLAFLAPREVVPLQAEVARVPFPVHIQALIGTAAVLWLFRLVGLAWVALAFWR